MASSTNRQLPNKIHGLIADAMLGSLARKLRIFGYDTKYLKDVEDTEFLKAARREGRLILTSDRALLAGALKANAPAILVSGENDKERLRCLVRHASSLSLNLSRGDTRCALCNGTLRSVERASLSGLVPHAILQRHRLYYRCRRCGKVYWRGGHWSRLRRLSRALEDRKRI